MWTVLPQVAVLCRFLVAVVDVLNESLSFFGKDFEDNSSKPHTVVVGDALETHTGRHDEQFWVRLKKAQLVSKSSFTLSNLVLLSSRSASVVVPTLQASSPFQVLEFA